MNCEKLSLDACMHAAQNDRLPIRSVIQVSFASLSGLLLLKKTRRHAHTVCHVTGIVRGTSQN